MNDRPLRRLSDAELEREVAALEARLDRLDDAVYPAATLQRADALDMLVAVRAEQERRAA